MQFQYERYERAVLRLQPLATANGMYDPRFEVVELYWQQGKRWDAYELARRVAAEDTAAGYVALELVKQLAIADGDSKFAGWAADHAATARKRLASGR